MGVRTVSLRTIGERDAATDHYIVCNPAHRGLMESGGKGHGIKIEYSIYTPAFTRPSWWRRWFFGEEPSVILYEVWRK